MQQKGDQSCQLNPFGPIPLGFSLTQNRSEHLQVMQSALRR